MTRKDYELIAKSINHHLAIMGMSGKATSEEFLAVGSVAQKIAQGLAEDNPRFNRQKFLKACGIA